MISNHSCEGMDIRDARKRAGFTQVQLSEATGIDQASISRMENGKQGITLAWETASEPDNQGFNLWRGEAEDGDYLKLNNSLIPAKGDAETGASYVFSDTTVIGGVTYTYMLEQVDVNGVGAFYQPVSITMSYPWPIFLPLVSRHQEILLGRDK